jgi:hypothetical protein
LSTDLGRLFVGVEPDTHSFGPKLGAALKGAEAEASKSGSATAKKWGAGFAEAGLGAAVASVIAGSGLEDSQVLLGNALKDTHQSADAFGKSLDPLLSKMEKWGFTNEQVDTSLGTLVRAGAKSKDALKDEALAADIARARHIGLGDAVSLEAKVITGHVALLGRMGIATKDSTGKTISAAAAMKLLGEKFGGAAAVQADTFRGKIDAGKTALTDMAAKIGEDLIPILLTLGTAIAGVVDWLTKHKAVAIALGVVIGAVVTGLVLYAAVTKTVEIATKLWTGAQWLFNAAMDASPVVLAVGAIIALGAGIYLAYQKFGPFRAIVDDTWNALKLGFSWVKQNWPLLLAILTGPFGLAVLFIKDHFNTIVKWCKDLVGHIGSALSGLADAIEKPFKTAFDWVTRAWNDSIGKVFSLLFGAGSGKAPSIVSPNKQHPTPGAAAIPGAALGGILKKGRPSWVGELGPEIAVPLQNTAIIPHDVSKELDLGFASSTTHIDNRTIVEGHVYGDAHMQRLFDEHDEKVALTLTAGQR